MNNPGKSYTVRAAHCDHRASEEEVYAELQRITAPLERSWQRLEAARRIVIKANIVFPPEKIRSVDGRRQELVDDVVLRGVLRLLRSRTRAQLLVADTTQEADHHDVYFLPLLQEFGAEYIECNNQPFAGYDVPGGGLMFSRYQLNPCFRDADAVVSVATLKSHAYMGVTLTTKNLFGLCPIHRENRPRTYFHHIIRLPYVLADLARIVQPCLNIIDGLVASTFIEWNGEARISDTLVAGDHCIATDACAATLMGHNPQDDWPTAPFRRDRNHLRASARSGYGTVDLNEIDFVHDLQPPVAHFDAAIIDTAERVESWRRTMCEQALFYRDHREEFLDQYAGEYIYLQDGKVLHHRADPLQHYSRRAMSGANKDSAIWLKYVDPTEWEGEHFERYEQELRYWEGKQ